jgi:hypothetical protein
MITSVRTHEIIVDSMLNRLLQGGTLTVLTYSIQIQKDGLANYFLATG